MRATTAVMPIFDRRSNRVVAVLHATPLRTLDDSDAGAPLDDFLLPRRRAQLDIAVIARAAAADQD
jgi:hypothetical protein